jgi:phosphate starvation-inducible PhoH-like protein
MSADAQNQSTAVTFDDIERTRHLFGERNRNLMRIAQALDLQLHARGNRVQIQGESTTVRLAGNLLQQLYDLLDTGIPLMENDVDHAIRILSADDKASLKEIFLDAVGVTAKNRHITPKTRNQKRYIDAIRRYDMVFGIGPAGTGKTYLAMAMAVSALTRGDVSRIILTRPAVEAGEALGFLPGDLTEKVDPYLRPLYDALHDMMRFEKASGLMERGVIEVAPLAFMRGRTLNDAFVILDEAQNTTSEQMRMFLTRIGFSSKAVITGDVTQTDLPADKPSGLVEASQILDGVSGLRFVYFEKADVIRHRLVQKIIQAYEQRDENRRRNMTGQAAEADAAPPDTGGKAS